MGLLWMTKHPKTKISNRRWNAEMFGELKIRLDSKISEEQHFELLLNPWTCKRKLG